MAGILHDTVCYYSSGQHYHFVRERVLSGEVDLLHVSTDRQVANIFTKPLGLDKLWHFLGELW